MSEWQPIETAPKGVEFLALQGGEIYHALIKDGRMMFRTHKLRCPKTYRIVEAEMDGKIVQAEVLISLGQREFRHDWTFWTDGFDFKPTHWAPVPQKASEEPRS